MTKSAAGAKLTATRLIAFALPAMVISLAVVPVTAMLPTLYAQYANVAVAAAGTIFLLRSIYDAVSDQLIGFLSDRTRTPIGARLPWIISGSVVVVTSVLMLFRIPAEAGVAYFGIWTLVFYTGYTMVNIPYFAWANELTSDYQQTSRVFAYKGFFESVGTMLVSLIPMALVFLGVYTSTDYTPEMTWLIGLVILVALPLSIAGAFLLAPRGHVLPGKRTTIKGLLRSAAGNRPFQRFIMAYVLAGTGYGFSVALIFPFTTSYLGIGDAFPMILLVATVSALVAIPIWTKIVYWLGKHRAWAWGWIANSLVLVPLIWVPPGESAKLPMAIMMGLYGFTNSVSVIAPFSILGDVVDYDRLRTGVDRGGNYYAFMMFTVKLLGSAGGVALIILGAVFGYELAEGAVNDDFANKGLLYMFVLTPGIFQLASVPLIWNFPINARRQSVIRRRLESLDARAERAARA